MLKKEFRLERSTLSLATVLFLLSASIQANAYCRCMPGDPCWPKKVEWDTFNTSLNGNLVIPRPTAYICYPGPDYNPSACETIKSSFTQPSFLIRHPGSMQNFNWEDLGQDRCSIQAASLPGSVCHSGSVSTYGVVVHSVEDIQNSIAFARRHNLRLVIKSTGHDYLGRSAAPGSLLLWMHKLSKLKTRTSFLPDGCSTGEVVKTPVVIATGGITWDDVYRKVDKDFNITYAAVGGSCQAIGAAGGYVQGGGHSVLSPSFGLAADSVLQMQLVTADGQLLNANKCQNQDLFWALRGGGGGTFGVVISVTYRLHPVPNGFTAFSVLVTNHNRTGVLSPEQVEKIVEGLARRTSDLDEAGWGGLFYYSPAIGFRLTLLIPADKPNALPAMQRFQEELVDMQWSGGFAVGAFPDKTVLKHYDKFQDWHEWIASHVYALEYNAGGRVVGSSRLIPQSAFHNPQLVAQTIVSGMKTNGFQFGLIGHFVVGKGVREHSESAATSVSPAWRQAAWQTVLYTTWSYNSTDEEISQLKAALNAGTQVWRDAYPGSGAYYNEAFTEEPDWQETFWGSNYQRLLNIKTAVDPDGLFVCLQCVGSERWDRAGNCRTHSSTEGY